LNTHPFYCGFVVQRYEALAPLIAAYRASQRGAT
jgi:hypothetical protein